MKIRFTNDAIYETEGPGRGRQFRAGKVYDLPDDQAKRWIRRNSAEKVAAGDDTPVEGEEQAAPKTRVVEKGEAVHPAVAASRKDVRGKLPEERTHTADLAVDEDAKPGLERDESPLPKSVDSPAAPIAPQPEGTSGPGEPVEEVVPDTNDPAGVKAVQKVVETDAPGASAAKAQTKRGRASKAD